MSLVNQQASEGQSRGIRLTLFAVVTFMVVVVAGFVYRIQQPRVMTDTDSGYSELELEPIPVDGTSVTDQVIPE